MLGWMKHKLESRLPGEISITLDTQMTPWTVAYQASPSMGFSRQEYSSVLPFLPPHFMSAPRTPIQPDLGPPSVSPWPLT